MFPESFVTEQVLAHSRPKELVFDPFCGRGTTVLESLLNDRAAIGADINPVAACIAGAKANVPKLRLVIDRLDALESLYELSTDHIAAPTEFFSYCYHPRTFSEVAFLRHNLAWQKDDADRFIAAVMLGVLHGESHRSEMCLSNRMPRTISTKPDYSVRWWQSRNMEAPERETFRVLRQAVTFRYAQRPPSSRGQVLLVDARRSGTAFKRFRGKVSLVVTSPPYLDTTDYSEDQWLRLWFLGGAERPVHRLHPDDRHTDVSKYWNFLREIWKGVEPLLREHSTIVVRIGGTRLRKHDLLEGLLGSMHEGMSGRKIRASHSGRSSLINKRQTNAFRPGTNSERSEHDFTFSLG